MANREPDASPSWLEFTEFPQWLAPQFGSFDNVLLAMKLAWEMAHLEGWQDVMHAAMATDPEGVGADGSMAALAKQVDDAQATIKAQQVLVAQSAARRMSRCRRCPRRARAPPAPREASPLPGSCRALSHVIGPQIMILIRYVELALSDRRRLKRENLKKPNINLNSLGKTVRIYEGSL